MRPARVAVRNAEGFEIDDDFGRLDFDVIHGFLTRAYWSEGIPRDVVERAARNSWCFGVYAPDGVQIGYARLVSDYETFAYLADVFIIEERRGLGLSKWLMASVIGLPTIAAMRRVMLATRTAHGLYEKSGFRPLGRPDWFMEINRPEIYRSAVRGE